MQDRYSQLHDLILVTRDIRDQKQLIDIFVQSLLNGPLKTGRKHFEQACFFLFSRSRNTLNILHAFRLEAEGKTESDPDSIREISSLLLENIARFRQPAVRQPAECLHTFKDKTYLIHPISVKGRSIGFFVMSFKTTSLKLSSPDKSLTHDFLQIFQDEFYILHIFQLVIKDELTQLYNKRYLLDELARDFLPRKKQGRQLCLALMDIDRFKHYNDSYGHQIGDHLLKSIASLINSFSEANDIMAFRYGGEEMAIIFKDRDLKACWDILETLRGKIEDADFSTQQWFLKLRVSGGLADICTAGSYSRLIEQADAALYESKRAGRNRITVFSNRD
jgi:diguanylate cyclase (GGDEF)-like protein